MSFPSSTLVRSIVRARPPQRRVALVTDLRFDPVPVAQAVAARLLDHVVPVPRVHVFGTARFNWPLYLLLDSSSDCVLAFDSPYEDAIAHHERSQQHQLDELLSALYERGLTAAGELTGRRPAGVARRLARRHCEWDLVLLVQRGRAVQDRPAIRCVEPSRR